MNCFILVSPRTWGVRILRLHHSTQLGLFDGNWLDGNTSLVTFTSRHMPHSHISHRQASNDGAGDKASQDCQTSSSKSWATIALGKSCLDIFFAAILWR